MGVQNPRGEAVGDGAHTENGLAEELARLGSLQRKRRDLEEVLRKARCAKHCACAIASREFSALTENKVQLLAIAKELRRLYAVAADLRAIWLLRRKRDRLVEMVERGTQALKEAKGRIKTESMNISELNRQNRSLLDVILKLERTIERVWNHSAEELGRAEPHLVKKLEQIEQKKIDIKNFFNYCNMFFLALTATVCVFMVWQQL